MADATATDATKITNANTFNEEADEALVSIA